MFRAVKLAIASLLLASAVNAAAQSGYQVVSLNSSGTIVGTVKWSGPLPRLATYPITKDPAICDPESHKTRDLERLIVGPQGGVANTVPFPNQVISRAMQSTGLVDLKCNGGHVWMNAELMVVPHPYYVVTDESRRFELNNVPRGSYEIVAWHEGWGVVRQEAAFDVLTERRIQRPVFTEPKTWEQHVTVNADEKAVVNFVITGK